MGDEEKVDQRQFKVILLGDGAVGKTSIATRFSHDEFTQSYKQTIGLDFFIKHLILPGAASPETASFLPGNVSAGDVHVAMQMWDIGQHKGDSTSLQLECSARARSGNSIHASRPFREMIARPRISQNEWKTAEI